MEAQKLSSKTADVDYLYGAGIVAVVGGRTGAGQLYTNNVTVIVPGGAHLSQPELIEQGSDMLEAFADANHLVLSVDKVQGDEMKFDGDVKLQFFA